MGFLGFFRVLSLYLSAALLCGCSSLGLGYLVQAGKGQLKIINHARPLNEVLADERTSPRVKLLLQMIPKIKEFSEENGLRPTQNYTEYVQLNSPAVTWVVSGSDSLAFRAKVWTFPIVGSLTYVGWFNREDADKYATELRTSEGIDVDVRGAAAYSTIGWFKDPILSSMIGNGADAWGDLVNTVIHESAHATFYVKNQSYFNESLAQFIGDELTPVFLKKFLPHEIEPYLKEERNSEERATQFQKGYLKLSEIYRSSESSEIKLKRKQEVLEQMKAALGIKREINNATLIQYRTYGIGKNDFLQLLSRCEGDWKKFFGVISSISAASFAVDHSEDFSEVLKLK